ncbi:hypothetical protein KI387_024183, partial [Taxus chinensis]
ASAETATDDAEYYRQMLETVTIAHIRWRPYGNYMVTVNIAEAPFSLPRPTLPEGPEEIAADRRVMDAGVIESYRLWWAAQLR